eukprot:347394_1
MAAELAAHLLINDDEKKESTQPVYSSINDRINADDSDDGDENELFLNGYYNENTLQSLSLKVIKQIISRHYGLLFTTTAFGASIGFIIYLICSYNIFIFILGIIGFIIGLILDRTRFDKKKRTKLMVDYKTTKEEIELLDHKWTRSFDDEFYIQSDFFTAIRNIYRGSSRVYHKKNSGALVFEKKAFRRVEEYYGFEIGGGFASFIGLLITLPIILFTSLKYYWLLATIFVVVFIIIFGLIGCIIERELRTWNYLSPINVCITRRDSIALHDISHISCYTFGYHLKPMGISDEYWIEWLAIIWFKFIALIFYGIYFMFKFICYVFWLNSAFTLWIFITITLGLLFHIQITKNDNLLNASMWCVIVSTLIAIMCCIFVSPCYRKEIKIGALSIQQLQTHRIDGKKQNKLFMVFLLSITMLIFCSFFIVYVAADIHNISHKYFHTNKYSSDVWNNMVCKDKRGTAFPFGSVYKNKEHIVTDVTMDKNVHEQVRVFNETQLCDTTNYEFLAVSLLLLCILWYLLLFVSYWWSYNDKYTFSMEGKKTPRKWTQYSYIYIYTKSNTYGVFKKYYSIELTDKNGKELQHYLNQICPWYKKPKFVAIHPHSLEFVQAFETQNKIE